MQGRYDEAVEQLQHALRLSPNDSEIQGDLRQVLAARAGASQRSKAVK
ncbi:MAG: tetratricopeptide repeat protein [Vicinamibacterales bacterium]